MEKSNYSRTGSTSSSNHQHKRTASHQAEPSSHKRQKMHILSCTACSRGADAEVSHPVLGVPICGACNVAIAEAGNHVIIDKTKAAENVHRKIETNHHHNDAFCTWCGGGDGEELILCDGCPKTFCSDCVRRNFGAYEAQRVMSSKNWHCYLCTLGTPGNKLCQLREEHIGIVGDADILQRMANIDKLYKGIQPPSWEGWQYQSSQRIAQMSRGERYFASLFSASVIGANNETYAIEASSTIAEYLRAPDVSHKLLCLSKKLRNFFRSEGAFLPGLRCRLLPHQQVSLRCLINNEIRTQEFGALRGGVFADAPGLGKTVTVLALLSATAGTRPQQPDIFWDNEDINNIWKTMRADHERILNPVMNKLVRTAPDDYDLPRLEKITDNVKKYCSDLDNFEETVKRTIRLEISSFHHRTLLLDQFRHDMVHVRAKLDPSNRKRLASTRDGAQERIAFERSLYPSSATLIIVPDTLLEHWLEQIKRHLNLQCFTEDSLDRGVVFLDGFGDIVDIETPLFQHKPKAVESSLQSAAMMAHYHIVLSTFERCAAEHKRAYGTAHGTLNLGSSAALSPLLGIRWLRVIVDEGHEIGQGRRNRGNQMNSQLPVDDVHNLAQQSPATAFISVLAAERRWVMSGTPTTGAMTEVALQQIFRLLMFLRHPYVKQHEYTKESVTAFAEYCYRMVTLRGETTAGAPNLSLEDTMSIIKSLGKHDVANKWQTQVIDPCIAQESSLWIWLKNVLRFILIRHTKADVNLPPPVMRTVNMDPVEDLVDANENRDQQILRAADRAKALHIIEELKRFREKFPGVAPKAIVFSQHDNDLNGVGHFLYTMLGEDAVCEHFAEYESSELLRFRHSKKRYRVCPMCGSQNLSAAVRGCDRTLCMVEYQDVKWQWNVLTRVEKNEDQAAEEYWLHHHSKHKAKKRNPASSAAAEVDFFQEGDVTIDGFLHPRPRPQPGGHGSEGPGGHFRGRCLCTPTGCPRSHKCNGYPNPFEVLKQSKSDCNRNYAIVSPEHMKGYSPGDKLVVGTNVIISVASGMRAVEQSLTVAQSEGILWRGGRKGGRALLRLYRKCGGLSRLNSWHGDQLANQPWVTEEQDAPILLLRENGSTGLDLSFVTHIFLLEKVKDPHLREQIISRANRMGARQSVQVDTLQVTSHSNE